MELVVDGKLLGRTPGSWARILGFYFVYYSFLSCLIYFTVTSYADNLEQPGRNVQSTVNTRHDQPGASVFPFNGILNKHDGDDNVLELNAVKSSKNNDNEAYTTFLKTWMSSYHNNTQLAVKPSACTVEGKEVEEVTCKVPNYVMLKAQYEKIEKLIEDKTPIFTTALNKNFKWEPLNSQNRIGADKFVKNSVQAKCFEANNDGSVFKNSNFKVSLIGPEKAIMPQYFPYIANDKGSDPANTVPYNKPFLIGKIELADQSEIEEDKRVDIDTAWKLTKDQVTDKQQTHKIFRCEFFADNIEKPATGTEFNDKKNADKKGAWNDLTKLSMGFVQFGFNYVEK